VPEIIDQVFAKTSPKRSFSMTEYERFGPVFTKTRVYKFGQCTVYLQSIELQILADDSIVETQVNSNERFENVYEYRHKTELIEKRTDRNGKGTFDGA
jgi:hypothetical protein